MGIDAVICFQNFPLKIIKAYDIFYALIALTSGCEICCEEARVAYAKFDQVLSKSNDLFICSQKKVKI